jgi:hypothetical protein
MVGEQLQEIGLASGGILLEPVARNTAPAIAIAALHVAAADPAALMLVLPADHLIEDEAAFREAVVRALPLAREGWLVTFGIEPDAPETGYGYIERGQALDGAGFRVARFVEKPDLATARAYVEGAAMRGTRGCSCSPRSATSTNSRSTRRRCAPRPTRRMPPRAATWISCAWTRRPSKPAPAIRSTTR